MALAGGRGLQHGPQEYEWVVRRRGNAFRLIVQDTAARGQLLIAELPVYTLCLANERHGNFFIRTHIRPALLRQTINQALREGWRHEEKGLPPFRTGSALGWAGDIKGFGGLDFIDALWTVLNAVGTDPGWRERLAGNSAEFVPVPAEYVLGLDPGLEGRLAGSGGLVVYARVFDPKSGDVVPHLAIRALSRPVEVLEEIADWHRGFSR